MLKMFKKLSMIIFFGFIVAGCTPVDSLTSTEIIDKNITTNINLTNQYRTGYKYYLPRGLKITKADNFNEIAKSGIYNYYLYFDVVSYYNNIKESYEINKNAYLSMPINHGEKFGYLEVNQLNDKYLIEIMYNYAKIEVIVKKKDINLAISNGMTILTTVKYNNKILDNLMGENILNFREIKFNIFETTKDIDSSYLTAIDSQGQTEEVTPDPDLIH